jgi:hypothetical protein
MSLPEFKDGEPVESPVFTDEWWAKHPPIKMWRSFFHFRASFDTMGLGAEIVASDLLDWHVGIIIGPVAIRTGMLTYYTYTP